MERRLTAILIADVVDYSRLMGEDEELMLTALTELRRELFEPVVARRGGRVIKRMGDGWIIEYSNVSDAAASAIEVQESLSKHEFIRMRVGIHSGDVTFQDNDVYGDGINVAARLEAMAEPGQVLISDTAHHSLDGKAAIRFSGGESHELKNIARPVAVWRWPAGSEATSIEVTALPLPDKPSIAVLPFNNMSGDPEQEFFADGISEDIITDLSKISSLFVIARNSSFVYKGGAVNIPTIAKELGVRYVLEGSVRRGGNRVRINAQLIEAETGGHLWAERYDRDLTDIFTVQDEVTANIVQALAITLGDDEQRRIVEKGTEKFTAYECVLRGREIFLNLRDTDPELAKAAFYEAIELDPNFGRPHAYLAQMHLMDIVNGWSDDPQNSLVIAEKFANKGAELAPEDAHVHIALGALNLFLRRHEEAIAEAERAVKLDPNYAHGLFDLGWYLQYAGRAGESLKHFDRAIQLDPHFPEQFLHFIAQAYFQLGRYDDAVELLRQRIARNPRTDSSRMMLAACYGHLGLINEARTIWTEMMRINPNFSLDQRRDFLPYKHPEDFEKIVVGLKKADLPE